MWMFFVDYNIIGTNNILDIHKYLMMLRFIFKIFIGLLKVCTIGIFGKSSACHSEVGLTCISLDNRPCQAKPSQHNINI